MTPLSASAPDERDKVSAIAPIPRISMVPPSVSVCIPRGQRTRLVSDAQIKPKRRPNCHQESVQLRNRTRAQKVPRTEPIGPAPIRSSLDTAKVFCSVGLNNSPGAPAGRAGTMSLDQAQNGLSCTDDRGSPPDDARRWRSEISLPDPAVVELNPHTIGRIHGALVSRVDPDPAVRRSQIGPRTE